MKDVRRETTRGDDERLAHNRFTREPSKIFVDDDGEASSCSLLAL